MCVAALIYNEPQAGELSRHGVNTEHRGSKGCDRCSICRPPPLSRYRQSLRRRQLWKAPATVPESPRYDDDSRDRNLCQPNELLRMICVLRSLYGSVVPGSSPLFDSSFDYCCLCISVKHVGPAANAAKQAFCRRSSTQAECLAILLV